MAFCSPILPAQDRSHRQDVSSTAPSFPANTPGVNQNYVFNWTPDAAITAVEISAAKLPVGDSAGVQPLIDYVTFAETR